MSLEQPEIGEARRGEASRSVADRCQVIRGMMNSSKKGQIESARIVIGEVFSRFWCRIPDYRIVQDRLFESDFDRLLKQSASGGVPSGQNDEPV
ncbi:hypothetical protein PY257_09275 [Ramlibacter sp. H39-3-26]|uniref:hypothetical protein n=1 Tax=Curvibacter soli TaxID=3031331 RepID=UPI0023DA1A91|nr:hypothetical protein [Ramlibacter sp. H39-3-26]MDF1485367.1 hypothetical protein [Ramlibacter sp. H39-3-26]